MKVYFSASRFYRSEYESDYRKIIEVLKRADFQVLDNSLLPTKSGSFQMDEDGERVKIYKNMMTLMEKADIAVFEASYPSTLHIGHEITVFLDKGKPVIVLYTPGHEPILFKGLKTDRIIWVEYTDDNLKQKLEKAVEEAKKIIDVRFNFFVSPKILNYLDWVAQKRMVPRSVFLRDLIEKEMRKDKEFRQ
jgi:hypothetical protein